MKYLLNYIIILILSCNASYLFAQNMTGTWEGYMTGEFIQINVEQKGNELCGYTYDYELNEKSSHCIAPFTGRYDPESKLWVFSGKSFIENSGSHVLMRLILWRDPTDNKNILRGKVYLQSSVSSMFGMGGDDISVKRVSSKPQQLGSVLPPCFPQPKNNPVTKKVIPVNPKPTPKLPAATSVKPKKPAVAPTIPKPLPPPKKIPVATDTLKKVNPVLKIPVITQPDKEITKKMNLRKQTEQNRLEVSVKRINLKVYDNGIVDNDTVSIFLNGRLLVSHQRLSETAIELNIDLEEGVTLYEITMYAENLGSIPPNTALIVITAGDKRYELRSKASLEENAVLVIEYKPGNN